ncbi:MAG: hypothetical protein ABSD53_20900, partial [Terriglobales bacterium]
VPREPKGKTSRTARLSAAKASSVRQRRLKSQPTISRVQQSYATHVLDVYDHFSWRWTVNQGTSADANLKTKPDDWLNWYFDPQGNIKTAQLKFWMQATV